jgi:hypothetical protein
MIYTSYYSGKQIGKSVSISLRPPKGCSFDALPLFAPSEDLLKFWKSSKKDESAQQKYSEIFREEMAIKDQFIDLWLGRIKGDITLNCYEKSGDFCHRYIVGEIIKFKKPELWGGEVSEINEQVTTNNEQLTIVTSHLPIINSRPTKLISDMTWGEILGSEITAVFDNKPPLPEVAVIKPWKINLNQYAVYGGDVVKIVGGDRKGEWQLERSPNVNPTHDLPNHKQWVKTSALTQPPKGHETWTDADFKKAKKAS